MIKRIKHPNALKHGAFAISAMLPGEDRQEFDDLVSSLIKEWMPCGSTEHSLVFEIAKNMWRKARIQKFIQAKVEGATYDPKHVMFDRGRALAEVYAGLEAMPDEFNSLLQCLSSSDAEHLKNKFQPKDAKSSRGLKAIKKEIYDVLLPQADRSRVSSTMVSVLLDRSAQTVSPEEFERELAWDERLDAMIDRLIKRLIQIKAVKPMLNLDQNSKGDVEQ